MSNIIPYRQYTTAASALEELERVIIHSFHVLKPPPKLLVSSWADAHRYLSSESSAEGGSRWNTSRVEYMREIMDALCDKRTEEVSEMKSAQVAGTEGVLNVIGTFIDQDPCPILDVEPDDEAAKDFSRRVTTMVRDTPVLRAKVADEKGGRTSRNTLKAKEFHGGILYISGARSPSRLAAKPIRVLVANDIDRFIESVGSKSNQEGDPLMLAIKRTQRFWNRKILVNSTPTTKNVSTIESRFYAGSQAHRYVPCPLCGHYQILIFGPKSQFAELAKGMMVYEYVDSVVKDVWYQCENCGGRIPEIALPKMDRAGEWRHKYPERIRHRSYHIWEAYCYLVPGTWRKICQEFEESKHQIEKLRIFVNTVTGETFDEDQLPTLSGNDLYDRREEYYPKVPTGVLFMTAFIDVQGDRLECYVIGWGEEEECWLIDYFVSEGKAIEKQTWQKLDDYLFQKEFEYENGYRVKYGMRGGIEIIGVDSGDQTPLVYAYIKSHKGRRVYATKGNRGWGHDAVEETKSRKVPVRLLLLGVNDVKQLIRDRLLNKEPGAGYLHFNKKLEMDFFDQLLAERRKLKEVDGIKTYVWSLPSGKRNEAFDCVVGNYAMYKKFIRQINLKLYKERLLIRMEQYLTSHRTPSSDEGEAQTETPKPVPKPRRKGGWNANRW